MSGTTQAYPYDAVHLRACARRGVHPRHDSDVRP
jgi:hypothetical protein